MAALRIDMLLFLMIFVWQCPAGPKIFELMQAGPSPLSLAKSRALAGSVQLKNAHGLDAWPWSWEFFNWPWPRHENWLSEKSLGLACNLGRLGPEIY